MKKFIKTIIMNNKNKLENLKVLFINGNKMIYKIKIFQKNLKLLKIILF
jgi:hypothetical protein